MRYLSIAFAILGCHGETNASLPTSHFSSAEVQVQNGTEASLGGNVLYDFHDLAATTLSQISTLELSYFAENGSYASVAPLGSGLTRCSDKAIGFTLLNIDCVFAPHQYFVETTASGFVAHAIAKPISPNCSGDHITIDQSRVVSVHSRAPDSCLVASTNPLIKYKKQISYLRKIHSLEFSYFSESNDFLVMKPVGFRAGRCSDPTLGFAVDPIDCQSDWFRYDVELPSGGGFVAKVRGSLAGCSALHLLTLDQNGQFIIATTCPK